MKVTLDGDRDTHNKMRPLRGGQGTFDRIIENIRKVAGKVRIAVGGNFDADSVESYPALLDFLKEQDFARQAREGRLQAGRPRAPGRRRTSFRSRSSRDKPLNGTCMTAAGSGGSSICDTCQFVDEQLSYLREETKKRGFPTVDGVHMGPCEIHKRHAYTIGPNGSTYACPGLRVNRRCRPGTSTTARKAGGCRRRSGSNTWRRGTSAEIARLFRFARGAVRSPRTLSLAT